MLGEKTFSFLYNNNVYADSCDTAKYGGPHPRLGLCARNVGYALKYRYSLISSAADISRTKAKSGVRAPILGRVATVGVDVVVV